jgi:hypothetical protein
MTDHDPIQTVLEPNEVVELIARARQHRVVVTDRRLAVADDQRVAMHVPYHGLRRIQFDIERDRPATLVIVPSNPTDEPQVLAIPPEHYDDVAQALVVIGRRLAD